MLLASALILVSMLNSIPIVGKYGHEAEQLQNRRGVLHLSEGIQKILDDPHRYGFALYGAPDRFDSGFSTLPFHLYAVLGAKVSFFWL
jgi:hypothetical protein